MAQLPFPGKFGSSDAFSLALGIDVLFMSDTDETPLLEMAPCGTVALAAGLPSGIDELLILL